MNRCGSLRCSTCFKGFAIEEMARVAQPGAKIVIVDESERGARLFASPIPGVGRVFRDGCER